MTIFAPVTLQTPRLILRPPVPADLDAIFAIHAEPAVARYLGHPPWTERASAKVWMATVDRWHRDGSGLQLLLARRDDHAVLGTCTLFGLHPASRRAECGYQLASAYWGQGWMQEAMSALLDHGFGTLHLRRVEADAGPRNAASLKLLERLGFQREGLLRERWEVDGVVSDTVYYGLLAREWQTTRPAEP